MVLKFAPIAARAIAATPNLAGEAQPAAPAGSHGATQLVQYRPNGPVEACTYANIDYDNDGRAGCADDECWAVCDPLHPPGTTRPASAPYCGDGVCTPSFENCRICPADCGACPAGACGDFECTGAETSATCPNDC